MCPDNQLISVYLDGELPSPWKEKLEAHLEVCADCRTRLASYRRNAALLALPTKSGMEAAKERVWARLQERGLPASFYQQEAGLPTPDVSARQAAPGRMPPRHAHRQIAFGKAALWQKGVRVPLPFAVAAGVILIMALVLKPAQSAAQKTAGQQQAIPALTGQQSDGVPALGFEQLDPYDFEVNASVNGQAPDMSAILKLLEDDDSANVVIIKLPEKKRYNSAGGSPVILRAVDYAGQNQ